MDIVKQLRMYPYEYTRNAADEIDRLRNENSALRQPRAMENDMKDWATCETRGPFVRNSLKAKVSELRGAATKARNAYSKDFMGKPCSYIADAYEEAADALQNRLDAVTHND